MIKHSLEKTLVFLLALLFLSSPLLLRGDEANYVGTKKCKMCHRSEKSGQQFQVWEGSKHAKAYETLGTDEAKAIAAKAGVEGNPQESDKCLKCHVTAFGVDASRIADTFVKEQGVQCEACHGPGSNYIKMSVMKDRDAAIENGLVMPTEKECQVCHNDTSPTFKGFDFETYFKKIAHPKPAG